MTYTWRPVYVAFTQDAGEPMREVVRLPSNIKKVAGIKLVGCRQNIAEPLVLDIKEAQTNNDELLTNLKDLNSYFFIMPSVLSHHMTDAFNMPRISDLPLWDSSERGLRTVTFAPRNMTTLTFELRSTNLHVTPTTLQLANNEPMMMPTMAQTSNGSFLECSLWLLILAESSE
tara:strand:- start:3481 stop:3999 length:519 start_codon:yes stop_codon:yes gene_type:complete